MSPSSHVWPALRAEARVRKSATLSMRRPCRARRISPGCRPPTSALPPGTRSWTSTPPVGSSFSEGRISSGTAATRTPSCPLRGSASGGAWAAAMETATISQSTTAPPIRKRPGTRASRRSPSSSRAGAPSRTSRRRAPRRTAGGIRARSGRRCTPASPPRGNSTRRRTRSAAGAPRPCPAAIPFEPPARLSRSVRPTAIRAIAIIARPLPSPYTPSHVTPPVLAGAGGARRCSPPRRCRVTSRRGCAAWPAPVTPRPAVACSTGSGRSRCPSWRRSMRAATSPSSPRSAAPARTKGSFSGRAGAPLPWRARATASPASDACPASASIQHPGSATTARSCSRRRSPRGARWRASSPRRAAASGPWRSAGAAAPGIASGVLAALDAPADQRQGRYRVPGDGTARPRDHRGAPALDARAPAEDRRPGRCRAGRRARSPPSVRRP